MVMLTAASAIAVILIAPSFGGSRTCNVVYGDHFMLTNAMAIPQLMFYR